MIRLRRARAPGDLPKGFTGKPLQMKLQKLVAAKIAGDEDIDYKAIGDWGTTKQSLRVASFNKCAYCESDTAKVAHGDVEHFRPKDLYWWLSLCLDNYVYSCQLCNQSFKSNHFPITGKALKPPKLPSALPSTAKGLTNLLARICPDPADIVDEETLLNDWFSEDAHLPHPYLMDPEPLFAWRESETNQEVHVVEPPKASQRAKNAVAAATDYLGLNRETLTRSRYLIYAELRDWIDTWKDASNPKKTRERAERRIREHCSARSQYAGMCRFFARTAGFNVEDSS